MNISLVLSLVVVAAALQSLANLLLRGGILRHGEFSLTVSHLVSLSREPLFVAGFVLYGVSALFWFRVISIADLTLAYPILVGLSFVMIAVGAVIFFNESVSMMKFAGMITILVGIAVMARA